MVYERCERREDVRKRKHRRGFRELSLWEAASRLVEEPPLGTKLGKASNRRD